MSNFQIVESALAFAARAHDGHRRKSTDTPYIIHPVGVALLLQSLGAGPEVVAAGLLHDTVEDTDVTLAELRARFGPRVAAIVEGCSEPDKRWPWQQRKQYTIDSLREASLEVKLVSAADKLNNLRAIRTEWEAMGEAVWDRFHEGREQQEWYYRNVSASLNSGPHSLADHPLGRTLADEVAAFFGE